MSYGLIIPKHLVREMYFIRAVLAIIKIRQLSLPTLEIYESYFTRFGALWSRKSSWFFFSSFSGRTPPCVLHLFFSISALHPIRHRFL